MSVQSAIASKVTQVYGDQTPRIYKGNDYDGVRQATGWWYQPFNASPVFLGSSKAEALATLDDIKSSWEQD